MDKSHSTASDHGDDAQWASTGEMSVKPQLWMEKKSTSSTCRSLNDNQRTSLSAMIAYTSHKSGLSEFRIERKLSDHFKIPNTKCLMAHDYDEAIHYLGDFLSV